MEKPWLMRTYSGFGTVKETNQLYKANLAKGQKGLSIAFDLPTQIGYDSDHPLAEGEVGRVGVAVSNLEQMLQLFDGIDMRINTSMTINATAPWLLALYLAAAEKNNIPTVELKGTTQNDILKEFLARGTYAFPVEPSLRLATDVIAYTVENVPDWNPINLCSYHLMEKGATPVQEVAFTLFNAFTYLDYIQKEKKVSEENFPKLVGRISFFCNAGIRFIEEMCKFRAFTELWDEYTERRYKIQDEKFRRFRYGVQVNSVGLTAQQPENNIVRIAYEALAVALSKKARARALQLPAWNEALGLPTEWDQQLALRTQQILAYETDILEYEDLFDQNPVIEKKVKEMKGNTREELSKLLPLKLEDALCSMDRAIEQEAYKDKVAIDKNEKMLVGVNAFTTGVESPLAGKKNVLVVSSKVEEEQRAYLDEYRKKRNPIEVNKVYHDLLEVAKSKENIMPVTIAGAKAGLTTGEWAEALEKVFGRY